MSPVILSGHRVCRMALVSAVLSVLAGCSSEESQSFERWQKQTSAICTDYEQRLDIAEDEAGLGEVETIEALAELLDVVVPIAQEYTDALFAVGVPAERSAEVEALYASLQLQEKQVLAMRDTIEAGDSNEFDRLAAELSPSLEAANQAAHDLGVPACDDRE